MALLLFVATPLLSQSIFTYAGGGSVDGKPATVAALHQIEEIAVDAAGNLYIADTINHRIRRVSLATGVIATFAGSGAQGFSGDGGDARSATMFEPNDVAVDGAGNVFISDSRNFRVRQVSNGIITTIAGIGQFGSTGDGGPATAARLPLIGAIAVDPSGNLYISDGSNRIRKVDRATGIITTYAGGRTGFDGDGGPATMAALSRPRGIAAGGNGGLYIADYDNGRIRRIDRNGIISTIAGTGAFAATGDGGPATAAALHGPEFVDVDANGNLYIGEVNGGHIRKVDAATSIITTTAGKCCNREDGIPATEAHLVLAGQAVRGLGEVYVIDRVPAAFSNADSRIRRIDPATGIISTIAGVAYTGFLFTGDGGPATAAVLFLQGFSEIFGGGLALDPAGNLHIADHASHRIRKVSRESGQITTIAGATDSGSSTPIPLPGPIAIDAAGNIFVFEGSFHSIRRIDAATGMMTLYAGNHGGGSSGDGGPATLAATGNVTGLAIDPSGNLYVGAGTRVRRIDAATKIINTIAGSAQSGFSGDGGPASLALLSAVRSLALDSSGHLYIGDAGNTRRIRRIDAATRTITTVVGNGGFTFTGDGVPATATSISDPTAIGFDAAGNLIFADRGQKRVRKVDATTKIITTIAGTGAGGLFGDYSGDNGPATRANFSNPFGLAVDSDGTLFVSDSESNRVRVIYPCVTVVGPALLSPSNNSSGLTSFPKLTWRAVKGAFRYDVLLDTVDPPKSVLASNVTTTSFSPANLDALTRYYWQVIAKGDPYCTPASSSASEVRSFTTGAECGPPSPP